ncbi:(2Fe-2S) ferredoxin domain-containing protein [Alkaliphilus serpentinus]|uniref:(2Fe-2S) ferredoxin domain-containing protein n=1 Tax=Alkaliphilus serpentinus TaxID=1482731 RepID=A0A833HQP4_9FIRM|nr:(2Fe-2S) ferredoxin domain-containing protein [Alkaliphilus serpentinus]KAB3532162.1 (2Fe-2S) ferredoxin domain-containing protein [Alkaliphilus serpentinus]
MKIKSLEELKKIREESMGGVNLRHGEARGESIEILVGMGTCGISAGARGILNRFVDELAKKKIDNVRVIPVGCIGYCHSEPTVQINIPGQEPVLYGNITEDKVKDIVESHIHKGVVIQNLKIDIRHTRG